MDLLQNSSVEGLQKCVNVRAIIVSVVLCCVGVGVVAFALGLADATLSSLGLLVGCVAILAALYRVCFHATHYIYVPTGSEVKKMSLNFGAKKIFFLWDDVADKFGFRPLNCRDEQSEIRLDCIYSKDGKFAALQLSQYASLLYTPVTGIYELKEEKAAQWIAYLGELNK